MNIEVTGPVGPVEAEFSAFSSLYPLHGRDGSTYLYVTFCEPSPNSQTLSLFFPISRPILVGSGNQGALVMKLP